MPRGGDDTGPLKLSRFGLMGLKDRVSGLGFRVWDLGFRAQGLGFRNRVALTEETDAEVKWFWQNLRPSGGLVQAC